MLETNLYYVAQFFNNQFIGLVSGPHVEKEDAEVWAEFNKPSKQSKEELRVVAQSINLVEVE